MEKIYLFLSAVAHGLASFDQWLETSPLAGGMLVRLVFMVVALLVISALRSHIFGPGGIKNDWIVEAKKNKQYWVVCIYQVSMFALVVLLLRRVIP